MGQLIVGRPAPKQLFAVSAPLELTSAISLTFRAGAASDSDVADPGFDLWLVDAWRSLDAGLRHDLGLLLGFSGRLLYYIEELLFAFEALSPDRLDASFDDYLAFLESLPASRYQEMAANALVRIYRDRGLNELPPISDNVNEWRMFLRPGITRANIDEAAALVTSPEQLKRRTLALLEGFWRQCYEPEFDRHQADLQRAVRFAQSLSHPSVQVTFQELTGHRLPAEVDGWFDEVERVVFCPSAHVGSFIQYILYPLALILYFNAASVLRNRPAQTRATRQDDAPLETPEVLDGLRAMSDPSRMRIIEMLREGELYAQEIVAQLGISQSAVSRHLSTLESADLVTVRPSNGMKYYAIDRARVRALSSYIESLAGIGAR
ncbi:MAG: metalloregulator ArsR/SmtB family transcription factor [Chloroflexota bacterium]|nr:metalloregulator ArsR/SmtB family transcription factor [Chloroflexota bacterium]